MTKKGSKKRAKATNSAPADAQGIEVNEKPNGKRQQSIPGTERKSIPRIDKIAEKLRDVRGRRMALTKEESAIADDLIEACREEGIKDCYVYEDNDGVEMEVFVDDVVKVKVRKLKADDGNDE